MHNACGILEDPPSIFPPMIRIDSELLTVLRSLVMTGSQTKTSLSLSMSQSAVSRTLSHARELFNDPLFVRNGTTLVPTTRMLEIYEALPGILASLEGLFAHEVFCPEKLDLCVRIAAIDYAATYILLPAFRAMKAAAPNLKLEIQQLNDDTFRRLSLGLVDAAMRLECNAPNGIHSLPLYEARLAAVVCRGHPLLERAKAGKRLTFEDLTEYEFIHVNRTFTGLEWTAALHPDSATHPTVTVPYSGQLIPSILGTDWIAFAPGRLALDAVKHFPVEILPIALHHPKRMRTLYWHDRTHLDPAMQWVRSMIATHGRLTETEREAFLKSAAQAQESSDGGSACAEV